MKLVTKKKATRPTEKTRAMSVKIPESLMEEWDAITQRLDAQGFEVLSFQSVMSESFKGLLDRLKKAEQGSKKVEAAEKVPDPDKPPMETPVVEVVFLNVPDRADNPTIKALGAKFDGASKAWYVPPGLDLKPFEKWLLSA